MAAPGCTWQPQQPEGGDAAPALDPATVIEAVYSLEGNDRHVLFVTLDGSTPQALEETIRRLAAELSIDVLPGDQADRSDLYQPALTPVHPQTREAGIWVHLFGIQPTDPDHAEAYVTFSRSGLDGGDLELTFERTAAGWILTGIRRLAQA